MAKTTRDMGNCCLYFTTKVNLNGNSNNVVIDVENKLFARDLYWTNSDFLTLGKRDFRQLIIRLRTKGFEEVER